ncbi:hypothetical protein C7401_13626 [Paraburkholderia unamae]|uniref:hypothetical protein n=1 Tax=Paraburkholderia unamae TaxID=219649 RepID=UPI000DC46BCA|nr:hypothetical protein [Paraburkholderia unamae]RAR51666.1 hypothetical protein C7401_13626 [Paraburkholderia unamae]
MTEREEYDAWFAREFAGRDIPELLRDLGFVFWRGGRASLIAASGAPVEIRTLPEVPQ